MFVSLCYVHCVLLIYSTSKIETKQAIPNSENIYEMLSTLESPMQVVVVLIIPQKHRACLTELHSESTILLTEI